MITTNEFNFYVPFTSFNVQPADRALLVQYKVHTLKFVVSKISTSAWKITVIDCAEQQWTWQHLVYCRCQQLLRWPLHITSSSTNQTTLSRKTLQGLGLQTQWHTLHSYVVWGTHCHRLNDKGYYMNTQVTHIIPTQITMSIEFIPDVLTRGRRNGVYVWR